MPKIVRRLSDAEVRNAKPAEIAYKLFDGDGLYLEVTPHGRKFWRFKYRRPDGLENRLSFGRYPAISLAAARENRADARAVLAHGIDPIIARSLATEAEALALGPTFESVAREWHDVHSDNWTQRTRDNILRQLERDIFPEIGSMRLKQIATIDVLRAVRRIESRGVRETAHRITANVNRIFIFAVHSGLLDRNPADHLVMVLKPTNERHFAAIGPDDLPQFLRAVASNEAQMGHVVRIAMRLIMLVFVRTSELIETPWTEIDLEHGRWIIPWQRMKMGRRKIKPIKADHDTCLPRQALDLLRELYTYTGGDKYLFPNQRTIEKQSITTPCWPRLIGWGTRSR